MRRLRPLPPPSVPRRAHLPSALGTALLLAAAACVAPGLRTYAVAEHDAATFYATTSVSGASFSPDETEVLMTSDASGIFNVYRLPLTEAEPQPVRLTHSSGDATFSVSWFPGDRRFLFTADQGGNELHHLYVQEEDGTVSDLTPGEGLKAAFAGWLADGGGFFVTTNERDARFFDLYRYSSAPGYARQLVFRNEGGFDVSGVSRDGRWVALTRVRSNADSDLFVWDASRPDQEPAHVTPHPADAPILHGFMAFTPDGTQLYYSSNEASEFDRVWSYDLATGERALAVEADWDVSFCDFSWTGRYRVVGVNADARTEVRIDDLERGRRLALPDFPEGIVRGVTFSRSDRRIAFYVEGDTSPANLHVLDVDDGTVRRLTDTLSPAIDPRSLVASQVVRFPSFDGLSVPALLYRPHRASAEQPVPALVWVHGGPGGQSRVGYNPTIQHLVNHGYAVLAVNNRGSSGYGKTFFHLDDRRHGQDDLQDCIHGRRYLESLPWVDGRRVGIIGGSYGGFMVAAALAFQPEAFELGIDIFGVTNWLRTLESIPPWWADFRDSLYAEMGDPALDRERLTAISPLFHADRIQRPLLVVQGANDPRVLQVESDELVAAVRANGVPVEYVLFADEGHGFRSKANRIAASEAFLAFADRHLGPPPAP